MALLQLSSITKSYGGMQALKGVGFELRSGEVHALVGENGAGKSTLIKIITGALSPDFGTILLDGAPLLHNDPSRARKSGIAAIYQQPALFADLTVAECIALRMEGGGHWRGINWKRRRQVAADLLERVGSAVHPGALIRELSMPEQQLVEIAAALGSAARVLILDEPTASLGEREIENLFRVIRALRQEGVGLIYISHRLEELPRIADRVTVLRDGTRVASRPMQEVNSAELIRLMVGREVSVVFPKAPVPIGSVVLETHELSREASGVSNVSVSVRAGEILGVAGLVGAGRTELARILFGLTPATSGKILLQGKPVLISSPRQAVELGVAYVPEDRRRHGVILPLPIRANITLTILRRLSRGLFLDLARERRIASEYVERLAVKTYSLELPVEALSGGNQQKVALARWLATRPKVLILDEPTQGVDVGAKAEIHRLMNELAGRGVAIIMISSELPEVLGMSDRIMVMRKGQVAGLLDRSGATQERVLELAFGHDAQGAAAA